MPTDEQIDKVVSKALPEFEKALRRVLKNRETRFMFDILRGPDDKPYALFGQIIPSPSRKDGEEIFGVTPIQ